MLSRMGLTDGGNAIKERARERLKGEQEPKEERKKVTVRAWPCSRVMRSSLA